MKVSQLERESSRYQKTINKITEEFRTYAARWQEEIELKNALVDQVCLSDSSQIILKRHRYKRWFLKSKTSHRAERGRTKR